MASDYLVDPAPTVLDMIVLDSPETSSPPKSVVLLTDVDSEVEDIQSSPPKSNKRYYSVASFLFIVE